MEIMEKNLSKQVSTSQLLQVECSSGLSTVFASAPTNSLAKMESRCSLRIYEQLAEEGSPVLSPSHAKYVRQDLLAHVGECPATAVEDEANALQKWRVQYLDRECAEATVDIKNLRSRVRATAIQGTLIEQRILYLRQQQRQLEQCQPPREFGPYY